MEAEVKTLRSTKRIIYLHLSLQANNTFCRLRNKNKPMIHVFILNVNASI